MRIIATKTLRSFWLRNQNSEQALKAWIQEVENADWRSSSELKEQFRSASIISSKRIIFNIKGNDYRLIVDIEYRLQIVFIVWVGNHFEYDKIDVKKVKYVKANKKH